MPGSKVLDEELAEGLKKAKQAVCNFVLVSKGVKPLKLIVRKKPILEGEVKNAKAECKGNDVLVGTVQADGSEYVFSSLEETSIKPQAVKELIAEQTEITAKARFEQVKELPSGEPKPEVTSTEDGLKTQLSETLKKLIAQSGSVISTVPSIKDEVMRLAAAAKQLLKSDDLEKAKTEIMSLSSLLKSATSPPTDSPPPLPNPTTSSPPQSSVPPMPGSTTPPMPGMKPPPPKTGTSPTGSSPTGSPTGTTTTSPPKVLPGLKRPTLPSKLPGLYFRKTGAPLFTMSTGEKHPDQLAAEKFVEEHMEEIFGDPKDTGSAELDSWNDVLTTRGVNDAETTGSGPSAKELNCSFCTIGALLGKTSSEMSVDRQKKAGVTNPDPKLQEMTIWGNPTGDPSKADKATSDFDAQISPMKELAKDYADNSGGKYELVDNLKLKDNGSGTLVPETFDEKQLIADMKKLPNGTRFSVYMKGALPQESHWCYAEKRNDFIIFRDYQQSIQIPKGRMNEAFVTGPGITVDQLPLGPAKGNRIFVEGTFFAIKPKA